MRGRVRRGEQAACGGAGASLAWLVVVLLSLVLGGSVVGKSVPVPFSGEYLSMVWGPEDGLPENSCSGIVPAADGSLWLGTFRGLARFNGSGVARYAPVGRPDLARKGVVNLHRESGGRLWISMFGGLISLENGEWREWGETNGWKAEGDYVRSYADRPGLDPVLTRFGGQVYRLEEGRFREWPMPEGVGGSWAALDDRGTVYVVRGGYAGYGTGAAWEALPLPQGVVGGLAGAGQSRDGTALVVGSRAVLRYREGRLVGQVSLSQPVGPFWQAFEDSQGSLWLPSVTMGVYRVRPDGEVKWLRKADGLAHEGPTRAVYEDDQGGIWVGSGVGGVVRLTKPRFHYAGEHEGLGDSVTQGIAPLENGEVLLGIYAVGPRIFDGIQTRAVDGATLDEPLRLIRTVLRGSDGMTWMGAARSGLKQWDGAELRTVGTNVISVTGTLSTLFEDTEGRVWAGADERVGYWDGTEFTEVTIPERGGRGSAVYFTQHERAVFLTHQRQVFRYTAREGVQEWILLPEGVSVTGIVADGTGRIWVGSNGQGLFGYRDGELRNWGMSDGLPSDGVGSMIMDDLDHLWFASGRLAVRVEPGNLWESGGPARKEPRLRLFGEADGLRGLDFPIGTQPTVGKDAEGRLWFAQVRGAAMVDPSKLTFRDRPPRVSIELLRYVPQGERLPVEIVPRGTDELRLPPGIRHVEVRYTALDFGAPERHRFRVRLGGDRSEWQDMGGERSVVFFEMPPGRHRVRVAASGSDGVWNHVGEELVLVVDPFYWQTLWFRLGTALAVVGLAGVGGWMVSYRRWRGLKVQVALRQLATSLTEALDAPALGRRVAETCRTLFRHEAFFLVLLDRQGGVQMKAHAEDIEPGTRQPRVHARDEVASGTIPAAVLSGQALLLDGRREGGQGGAPFLFGRSLVPRVVSQMMAPIRWEERTIGVVSVLRNTARRYHHRDLDQLQMLAAHCGAAMARMEVEVEVRENEERLRLAMETARMGSWEMDLKTGALVASAEAEVVYGYARGTMSGDLVHLWSGALDKEGEEVRQQLEAIRRGEVSSLDAVHRIFVEGSERWLEVKGRVRRSVAAGSTPRLIGISADITERRQAERMRERLEAQLLQSQKQEAIGTLAGGIAHDFNNLLAVILGNVETAQLDTDRDHPVRESLEEIHKAGLRARDLVRRILAFSRPQDHLHKVVQLEPIVQEVAQLLHATIPAGVEIKVVVEGGAPAVLADASQIHQVLLNLGTNAWHAIHERRGQITFRLVGVTVDAALAQSIPGLRVGRHALVQVIDDGQGMSGEVQSRIFDPFFTTKPPGKGTGLGLPMALGIVKSHGGVLTVESAVGRGATFSLYFPEAESGAMAESMAATVSVPETRPLVARILFVDDEEGLVRLVRRVLEKAGYGVEAFTEAQEARRRFLEDPGYFDAVISDLSMPGLSGLELARDILRVRPQMAMMLCSGNLSEGEASEAGVLGVRALLSKPFSSSEFLRAVGGMLSDRQDRG